MATLLANEEISQRIYIKTTSISLHLEPFLKTVFQFKENIPGREKKFRHHLSVRLQGHCLCLQAWRCSFWLQSFLASQGPEVEDEQLLGAN